MNSKHTPVKHNSNNKEVPKSVVGVGSKYRRISVYEAPWPPSGELEKINNIVPGSAKNIMRQFKKQAEHRRFMEKEILQTDIKEQKAGRWSGLYSLTLVLIVIIICIFKGESIVAGILATAVISIAGIFALGKKFIDLTKKQKDISKK